MEIPYRFAQIIPDQACAHAQCAGPAQCCARRLTRNWAGQDGVGYAPRPRQDCARGGYGHRLRRVLGQEVWGQRDTCG